MKLHEAIQSLNSQAGMVLDLVEEHHGDSMGNSGALIMADGLYREIRKIKDLTQLVEDVMEDKVTYKVGNNGVGAVFGGWEKK